MFAMAELLLYIKEKSAGLVDKKIRWWYTLNIIKIKKEERERTYEELFQSGKSKFNDYDVCPVSGNRD